MHILAKYLFFFVFVCVLRFDSMFVCAREFIVLPFVFVMEIAKSWLNIDIIENLSTHWQHRASHSWNIQSEKALASSSSSAYSSFHFRSNRTHVNIVLSACVALKSFTGGSEQIILHFFLCPIVSIPTYLLETCFTCCSYWFRVKNELRKKIHIHFCNGLCMISTRKLHIHKIIFISFFFSSYSSLIHRPNIKYYSFPVDEYSFPFQSTRCQSVW